MALPNWAGNTRYVGPAGPTGPAGTPGSSGGQTLYLDSATSTSVPTLGNLLTTPVLTAQTTISHAASSSTVLIAKFPTPVGALPTTFVPPGLWDLNIYAATSSLTNAPSFYWSLYQVDADGVSNPVLIADGAADPILITNLVASQTIYDSPLYIPAYTLTNSTKRLSVYLYAVYVGGSRTATFEFRAGAVSHLHTTLGEIAYNWSSYPATQNVNIAGYNVSNVGNLSATSVTTTSVTNTGNLALTSGTSNVNISAGNVISNDASFITSTSSVREQHTVDRGDDLTDFAYYNITAEGGKAGSINITAEGNSYEITPGTDGAVGGVININANTPVVTGPILTSALKMSAAGVNIYAGSFSSVGSLAGNMYLWSQLGTTLQCSPSPPTTTYVGQVYVYGSNGTILDGNTYAKEIRNYASNNLNIHPTSPYFVDMTRVQFIGMGAASNANLSNKVIRGDGTSILYDFGQVSSSGGNFTTLITQAIYNSGTGIGVADLTIRAYGNSITGTNYSLNLAASSNINMNPANGGSVSINNGNLTLNSNSITGISNLTGNGAGTITSFAGITGTGNITGFSNISNATALAITTPLLTITCNAEFAGGYLSMGNHMIDNITTAYFSGGGNVVGTSGNLHVNGAPGGNLTMTNTLNSIVMTPSNMTISNTSATITLTNGYNTWTLGNTDTDIYSGAGTATLRTSFRPINISNGYTTLVLGSNIYASAPPSNSIQITNTANSFEQNSNTTLMTTGTMTISNASNSIVQNSNTTITTSNAMTISNANASIVMPGASGAVATGGTITYEYGRKFHTFTTDGTFTVTNTGGVTFEIMVLAGGGGGGCQSGGGGGAGGMLIFENSLSNTSYSITIGAGGDGGVVGVVPGYLGGDTTFGTIATAYGGGGGGTWSIAQGRDGGCGGGGSELSQLGAGAGTMGVVTSGTVISNLYTNGGVGFNTGSMGGAGGGGTAEDGGSQYGANSIGANGGDGTLYYGTRYGAGGGGQGGGTYNPPYTDQGGVGGLGGGGAGGISTANGDHATGYGSGGGGGGGGTGGRGGDGSPGIVIISYPYSSLNLTSTGDMLVTSPNTFITGDLVIGGSLTVTATTAGDLDMDGNNILNVGNFNGFVSSVIQNPGYLQMYENTFTGLNGTRTYQIYGTTGWDGSAIKVGNLPAGCYNVSFYCTNNFRRHLSATLTTPGAAVATATTPAGNPPVAICFNSNDIDASNYVVVTTRTTLAGSVYRMYIDFTNGSSGGGDNFIMSIVLNSGQWDGTMGWVYP